MVDRTVSGPRGVHTRLGRWAAVGTILLLLVPLGLSLTTLWQSTGSDLTFDARERDGVRYLRPLVRLLSTTLDAQNAAVAGTAVDADAVRAALKDVDGVDDRVGATLGTTVRWTDLKARLDTLTAGNARGRAAR